MKKAPPVRISLRKLLVAMLAVGPVAILPNPLIAAIPNVPITPPLGLPDGRRSILVFTFPSVASSPIVREPWSPPVKSVRFFGIARVTMIYAATLLQVLLFTLRVKVASSGSDPASEQPDDIHPPEKRSERENRIFSRDAFGYDAVGQLLNFAPAAIASLWHPRFEHAKIIVIPQPCLS